MAVELEKVLELASRAADAAEVYGVQVRGHAGLLRGQQAEGAADARTSAGCRCG